MVVILDKLLDFSMYLQNGDNNGNNLIELLQD